MSAAQVWPGIGSGVDLGYNVAVRPGSPYVSVPDGRCGLAVAKGRLWWLGPSSRPWPADPEIGPVVGLRLSLSAGRTVAGSPLDAWRDCRVPLEAVWDLGWVRSLADRARSAHSVREVVASLAEVVTERLEAVGGTQPGTHRLADLITKELPVHEIAARLAVGPRQVHRRCLTDFGLPPTTLRRIMRLHRAARWRAMHPASTLADVATRAGFADQAHLARDCRALAAADARSALG